MILQKKMNHLKNLRKAQQWYETLAVSLLGCRPVSSNCKGAVSKARTTAREDDHEARLLASADHPLDVEKAAHQPHLAMSPNCGQQANNNQQHQPNDADNAKQACELRDQAYELCRKYLSGEWNNISSDDMVFKTVSGGLSNLLYLCSLPSTHTPMTGEPSQVLLRMYGQLLDQTDTKVTDSVITMLLSERKLGPKLYGIFPGGRLEEYIPARAMMCSELKVLTYAAVIARKLATVHHLKVPINKEPTWLADNINRWLANVRNYQHPEGVTMSAMEAELVGFNFEQEIVDMFAMLAEVESPIVFSHNDLQEGNILLPSDDANISLGTSAKHFSRNMVKQFENHIVFIDFEFCSYNHRGFDIGNHFCERMFDYSNPEWPHFYHYPDEWPNDEAKLFFIREYLKQSKQLSHNEKLDTEQHVLKEADFYTLAAHLMWTLWSINNARTSKISFGYLEYGQSRLEAYHQHKAHLKAKYNLRP